MIHTPGVAGGGVLDLHQVVDDPRLAADLADHPAGLHRDRPTATPAPDGDAAGTACSSACRRRKIQRQPVPRRTSRNSSVPRPTMTSQARCTVLTCAERRPLVRRARCRGPGRRCSCPSLGSDSHDASPGIGMPPLTRAVGVEVAEQGLGHVARRSVGTSSMAANFTGWLLYTQRASESPTPIWIGHGDGGHGERDDEPEAVIAVPAAAQHPDRVDRGDQEAADDVRGDHHVGGHQRHRVVEDHRQRDRRRRPCPPRSRVKPDGEFIQALAGDHRRRCRGSR